MSLSNISSTKQSAPTSYTSPKNTALASLADQFPNLTLMAGSKSSHSKAAGMTGKYNVMVDPTALRAMESNGKVKANLEETLGNVEKTHDEVEKLVAAGGDELVGLTSFVDKNGKDAGGIVVVKGVPREGMGAKARKTREKLQKELEEKHKIKLEEEERLKKKEERQKLLEGGGGDKVELSASSKVDVEVQGAGVEAVAGAESVAPESVQTPDSGAARPSSGVDVSA